MNEDRKTSHVMVEQEQITKWVDLLQFEFVEVSNRLWKEHLEHRTEYERRLCLQLMVCEFTEEHGFDSPAMGEFHTRLPNAGRFAFYGVLTEDSDTGSNLDFFLPEEVV